MLKAKNYKDHLLEQLQDPEEAIAYLEAAIHDDDDQVLNLALDDIAEAQKTLPHNIQ